MSTIRPDRLESDDDARAEYIQWMFFSPAALEPAMMEKFMGLNPNKEATGWGSSGSHGRRIERPHSGSRVGRWKSVFGSRHHDMLIFRTTASFRADRSFRSNPRVHGQMRGTPALQAVKRKGSKFLDVVNKSSVR